MLGRASSLWGCAALLCAHAQALADAGAVLPTPPAAHSSKLELQSFVQLFLVGFVANLAWQGLLAFRRARGELKAVRRR